MSLRSFNTISMMWPQHTARCHLFPHHNVVKLGLCSYVARRKYVQNYTPITTTQNNNKKTVLPFVTDAIPTYVKMKQGLVVCKHIGQSISRRICDLFVIRIERPKPHASFPRKSSDVTDVLFFMAATIVMVPTNEQKIAPQQYLRRGDD